MNGSSFKVGGIRVKYLYLLSCSLVVAAPAWARDSLSEQSAAAPRDADIVVLATGFAQPREQAGQAISVIDRARLDTLQSVSIADAVRSLPGVSVAQRGPVGGQTSMFLRGGNSSQTLVLVDGVRINDPSSPNAAVDFGSLLAGNAQRIEVLRGPNSIIWGSQAMGGVVNIESAAPTRDLTLRAAAEYGSADTVLARANVSGSVGAVEASLGGTFHRTDGISALASGTELDGSRTWALNGRVKVNLAEGISLDFRGYYNNSRVDFDSAWSGGGDALPVARGRQFAGYAGLNFDLADGRWRNRVAYTRTDIDRSGADPVLFSYNNYIVAGTIDRFEYRGAYDLAAFATLVAGAEHERIASSTSYEGAVPDLANDTVTSGYAQLSLRPLAGLTLTGGVRHDDYSDYGGHTTLGGTIAWALNDGATVLRATYGEGFRAPTLTEGQPPYGNRGLKPETARNLDVGVEQVLIEGKARVFATWYHRRTTDLIAYSFATSQSENIDRVDTEGLELGLVLQPTERLQFTGNYTLTNAINRSAGFDGKRLQLRPQHSASVMVDWQTPLGLQLGATAQLVGDSFDDKANLVRLDGHVLLALRAALPLNDRVELYGRVENLGNQRYQTVAGYGTYGRTGYAGVRARW